MPNWIDYGLCAVALALSGVAAVPAARAEPPADSASIWTLEDENSSITSSKLNDRYYVNGLRMGWTSPTEWLPPPLSALGRTLWGEGRQRMSVDISQSIYTPAITTTVRPDPADRPYAGVLTASFSMLHDSDTSRSILGLQAGLVGPDAEAEQVQNGFHDVIGFGHTMGWGYQLHDEPVVELLADKLWRVPLSQVTAGLEFDTVPQLEGGVGNLRVYGLTGGVLRVGQGLASDFGAPRLRPGVAGADAYVPAPTRRLPWYLFIGADGEIVARDLTIDGNTFEASAHASHQPFVGELEGGLAVMLLGVRISYTQVVQSQQTVGQHGGLHQFGSLSLSARF